MLTVLALVAGTVLVGVAVSFGPLFGAVALLGVAAGVAVVHHPVGATIFLAGLTPAVAGLARGLPVPGLRISEVLVVAVATIVLLVRPRSRPGVGRDLRWRTLDWIALAYVLSTLLFGLVATARQDITLALDGWGDLLGPIHFFLLYRALVIGLPTAVARARALDAVLIASIPVSILAILQAAQLPPVVSFLASITAEDFADRGSWALTRAAGPFPHWTVFGGYAFMIVLLAGALLLHTRKRHSPLLLWTALLLAASGLVLTLTFGSIIGALVCVLLLAAWSRTPVFNLAIVVAITIAASAVAAPLLVQRYEEQFRAPSVTTTQGSPLLPGTVNARIEYWRTQYIPALQGRWLTGYGPQLPASVEWRFSESVYFAMLMRGGVPLLLVYLGLMVVAYGAGRRRARSPDEDQRAVARAVCVAIVVLAVMQLTAPQFTLTGGPHVLWALFGVMIAGGLPDPVAARVPRGLRGVGGAGLAAGPRPGGRPGGRAGGPGARPGRRPGLRPPVVTAISPGPGPGERA